MITIFKYVNGGTNTEEVRCLSTDEKPTEKIHNGSVCIEIDTGKLYIFDKSSEEWKAI